MVGAYLEQQRVLCLAVVNYPFVVLGGIAAVLGALVGDHVCGMPPAPPEWVQVGSGADWANRSLDTRGACLAVAPSALPLPVC